MPSDFWASYETGEGVERDPAHAAALYRQTAEGGVPEGQYEYGRCLLEGIGVEKDETAGFEWMQRAAEQDDLVAMERLGDCYAQGSGTPCDLARAADCYRQAGEKLRTSAQVKYAMLLMSGPAPKDAPEGIRWLERAVEAGDAYAMCLLGSALENGDLIEQDEARAAALYQQAADLHHPDGMWLYACCLLAGKGVQKDEAAAARLLEQAAEEKQAEAMTLLGTMYETGRGVRKDPARAVDWYRRGAEAGDANADVHLASCLLDGEGTDRHAGEAVMHLEKAVQADSEPAMLMLADCCEHGRGIDRDLEAIEAASARLAPQRSTGVRRKRMCRVPVMTTAAACCMASALQKTKNRRSNGCSVRRIRATPKHTACSASAGKTDMACRKTQNRPLSITERPQNWAMQKHSSGWADCC